MTATAARPPAPALSALSALALRAVHVVVPAHDEQDVIGSCLVSVGRAVDALRVRRRDVSIDVHVVLDRCGDATAQVVAGLGVGSTRVDAGCVGAARALGVDRVARLTGRTPPARILVVNTDADCVVPADWLVDHVALARDHQLVLGGVTPDPLGMTPAAAMEYAARHPAGAGGVHGANLSFRLDAYLAAGGFPDVALHEDVLLVRAMRAGGARVATGTRVVTSARRRGRVAGGFAGYLRELDRSLAAAGGDA